MGMQGGSPPFEVTLDEGTNFSVALAPDDSNLVLDLQGTLWALPIEGGDAEALTDGLGDDRLPDYSPDGARLVFQSYRAGSWDIWAIGSDGSGLAALTEGRFDDREPVWSPDGTRIAFSSDRSGNYDIWILDVGRGEVSQLTSDPANDYMPDWSPGGNTIAFISERGEARTTELWTIDVGNGGETKIASFEGKAASPSWSRDGRRIALRLLGERTYSPSSLRLSEGIESDLLVVPARGGEPVKRTSGEDVFPFRAAWTRGGDIIYTSDGQIRRLPASPSGEASPQEIPFRATVTLNRSDYARREARIPKAGERLPVRGIVRPVLSPDGQQLAFTALGDIWLAQADGPAPMLFTRDEYLDSDPSWSPDGKEIVFASDRAGTMDLWKKKADSAPGSDAVRLTDLPGAEVMPVWSPDGRWIAYTDEQDDLYVIPADGGGPRLVRKSRRWAGAPSWSSDSKHLALATFESYSTRFREGVNRIVVISTDSGAERVVELPNDLSGRSFGTREGDGPVWSPDGEKLAFAMDGGLSILPVNAEGEPTGSARKVFAAPVHFPAWSPDSESLIFLSSGKLKRVDIESGDASEIPLGLSYRIPLAGGKMVIRNARIIDGTGAPPREDMDILIEGNRIESVQPAGIASVEDVRVIDASGKTVIPGLIDMHTHPSLPDYGTRQGRLWLAFGVTSIRTTSGAIYRTIEERESIAAGRRVGPRIFSTGFAMDGERIYYPEYVALENEEELLRELERAFALDYDLIKTYVRLPDVLQKKVVEEAHRKGVFVSSHEIYPAVAFGVDGIEHVRGTSRRGFSPKITDLRRSYGDFVELVSRSGAYLTPTLLVHGGFRLARARDPELLDDLRLAVLLPSWALDAARRGPVANAREREEVMEPIFATVRTIAEAGGQIVAGTDSPIVPYGYGLILEVEQMSEAGLGPLQAIRAATRVAARALGASDDLGTIRQGKIADMVILGGDPVADIRNLRRVEGVIVDGKLVELRKLVAIKGAH
jgi:Tol biopolymer transport system component/imidazolonepropionase-like amidohydrolase